MKSFVAWINFDKTDDFISTFSHYCANPGNNIHTCGPNGIALFDSIEDRSFIETDKLWILVNGQLIWSDTRLNQIAVQKGDAEAVLNGLADLQNNYSDILDKLHGHFSLVIVDKKDSACFAATDRIGTKSIAHTKVGNSILVSDSLDAMAELPFMNPDINPQSIFSYLYFHVIPSPDTIYKGYFKLPPSNSLTANNNSFETKKYWKPTFDYSNYDTEKANADLFQFLRNSIGPDEDLKNTATFLSGGLDSSTVTGLYSTIKSEKPTAFSIGFSEEGFDELDYARITAKHFNTILHEYVVTPADVASTIPLITSHFDEPFGNSSAVPTYICAKFAKDNGYSTLLAGDGGDEIFAGNERYAKQKLFELYYSVPEILRKSIIEPLFLRGLKNSKILPIHKTRRYIEQAKIPLPERLLTYNFFNITPTTEILSQDFISQINTNRPAEQMRDIYQHTTANNFLDKLLEMDWKYTLADNDLKKVGNMCNAASMKVQYPMLSDEVINVSCNIPPGQKLKQFKLRHFYKQAMTGFLSEKTLNKSKHGFGLPFGIWLQRDPILKEMVNDGLTSMQERNIFHPKYIQQLKKQHQTEHATYFGEFIWIILILEEWLKKRNHNVF